MTPLRKGDDVRRRGYSQIGTVKDPTIYEIPGKGLCIKVQFSFKWPQLPATWVPIHEIESAKIY